MLPSFQGFAPRWMAHVQFEDVQQRTIGAAHGTPEVVTIGLAHAEVKEAKMLRLQSS